MRVVEARGLTKVYGEGEARVVALDSASLVVGRGEFVAIMGPSGSGKSTLLHCLAGLDTPTSGSVLIAGQDLSGMKDKQLTAVRRDRLGFIFQSFNLLPTLSAEENILLPQRLAHRKPDRDWYDAVISVLGLTERLTHRPNELSGGQQQRVAVARALVGRPKVIFADEPTGALDTASAATLTMDHLLGLGHRRIAHISGPGTGAFPIRRLAYEERMRSHELSGHSMAESCDTTDDGGFAAAERLLTGPGPRPTALFAGNDLAALGALALVRSWRIAVPGELAIATIDDAFLAHNRAISLTSVGLKTERQGTLAGELMIRRIREPDAERAKLVMPPAGISIRNFTVA